MPRLPKATLELVVACPKKSIHFYQDLLGFALLEQEGAPDDPHWALLTLGPFLLSLKSISHLRSEMQLPDLDLPGGRMFLVLEVENLELFLGDKKDHLNIVEAPRPTTFGTVQCLLRDPDGYLITLEAHQ